MKRKMQFYLISLLCFLFTLGAPLSLHALDYQLFESETSDIESDASKLIDWIHDSFTNFDDITIVDLDWKSIESDLTFQGERQDLHESADEWLVEYVYDNESVLRLRFYEEHLMAIEMVASFEDVTSFQTELRLDEIYFEDDFKNQTSKLPYIGYLELDGHVVNYFVVQNKHQEYEVFVFFDEVLIASDLIPDEVLFLSDVQELNDEAIFRFVSNHVIDYYFELNE